MTLEEAQLWLRARLRKGTCCPCCGQYAKIYTRKLNKAMALSLLWLVKRYSVTHDWIDLSTGPKQVHVSRELAKLAHWKLIEQLDVPSDKGARTSGKWRPTELGIEFVKGHVAVPSYIHLYDGQFLGTTGKPIYIDQALPFEYRELWELK